MVSDQEDKKKVEVKNGTGAASKKEEEVSGEDNDVEMKENEEPGKGMLEFSVHSSRVSADALAVE